MRSDDAQFGASVLLFVMSCVFHAAVHAQAQVLDDPAANPGKPTISTAAIFPPTGYSQIATGFAVAGKSPESESRYASSAGYDLDLIAFARDKITFRQSRYRSVVLIHHSYGNEHQIHIDLEFLGFKGRYAVAALLVARTGLRDELNDASSAGLDVTHPNETSQHD